MGKSYCIFAAHYFPHLGGIERYVYNMSKKLLENGDKVTIVTSRVGELSAYELMDGIPVYRLSCYELLDGRYPVLKMDRKSRKIIRILKRKKFDLVVINARFYVLSTYAVLFAKRQKVPCMLLEHGSSHVTIHNRMWDFIGQMFEHIHTWVLKMLCDNFWGTCEACNEWLTHFHIKSKGIVYNAINMDEVRESLEKKSNYREKYNISEDDKVIVFTGRLLKEKGVLNLISAVEKVNQGEHKIYLFIAGSGDLETEIECRKSKYIIPLGYIEHAEVLRLLNEGDIYCLPSVSEAFCGGVLEAVACKCYVITTAQGGSKELISDASLGTIISCNDVDTVTCALEYAINHWDSCQQAIENAYTKLTENYTWDIVIDKFRTIDLGRMTK